MALQISKSYSNYNENKFDEWINKFKKAFLPLISAQNPGR